MVNTTTLTTRSIRRRKPNLLLVMRVIPHIGSMLQHSKCFSNTWLTWQSIAKRRRSNHNCLSVLHSWASVMCKLNGHSWFQTWSINWNLEMWIMCASQWSALRKSVKSTASCSDQMLSTPRWTIWSVTFHRLSSIAFSVLPNNLLVSIVRMITRHSFRFKTAFCTFLSPFFPKKNCQNSMRITWIKSRKFAQASCSLIMQTTKNQNTNSSCAKQEQKSSGWSTYTNPSSLSTSKTIKIHSSRIFGALLPKTASLSAKKVNDLSSPCWDTLVIVHLSPNTKISSNKTYRKFSVY